MNNSIKLLVNASIDVIYEDNEIKVNTFPIGYLFEYRLLPNGNYSCLDEDSTVVGTFDAKDEGTLWEFST